MISGEHLTLPSKMPMVTLVTDIRGFSNIVNCNSAGKVWRFIEQFIGMVHQIVENTTNLEQAEINAYLGDGFLIFLKDDLNNHAMEKAANIALELREHFRYLRRSPAFTFTDLDIGTGITSGIVTYGRFNLMEYDKKATGVGPPVNLAFRLAARAGKGDILVTEDIRNNIMSKFDFTKKRPLGIRSFGRVNTFKVKRRSP